MRIKLLVAALVAVLGATVSATANPGCCAPDAACCQGGPCC